MSQLFIWRLNRNIIIIIIIIIIISLVTSGLVQTSIAFRLLF